ncbi:hypothetical protein [Nevskia soli]|uniref:hypothetical protein n=1 Tax=Nevskia soli TaxID=418856 RepID=UPI001C5C9258|nr:hypothetical protein [Nevskia soli]
MPKASMTEDTTTLSMALVGFEMEKKKIDEKIAEIRAHLGHSSGTPANKPGRPRKSVVAASTATASPNGTGTATKKRTMSAAARKRIAAAQRKRWAEHRKTLAAGS